MQVWLGLLERRERSCSPQGAVLSSLRAQRRLLREGLGARSDSHLSEAPASQSFLVSYVGIIRPSMKHGKDAKYGIWQNPGT